jgi:hypothetical protein
VPGTSSSQHLAELLGHAGTVREAEARYAAGMLTNQEVSVLDAAGWAARSPAEIDRLLESLPLVDGITGSGGGPGVAAGQDLPFRYSRLSSDETSLTDGNRSATAAAAIRAYRSARPPGAGLRISASS